MYLKRTSFPKMTIIVKKDQYDQMFRHLRCVETGGIIITYSRDSLIVIHEVYILPSLFQPKLSLMYFYPKIGGSFFFIQILIKTVLLCCSFDINCFLVNCCYACLLAGHTIFFGLKACKLTRSLLFLN